MSCVGQVRRSMVPTVRWSRGPRERVLRSCCPTVVAVSRSGPVVGRAPGSRTGRTPQRHGRGRSPPVRGSPPRPSGARAPASPSNESSRHVIRTRGPHGDPIDLPRSAHGRSRDRSRTVPVPRVRGAAASLVVPGARRHRHVGRRGVRLRRLAVHHRRRRSGRSFRSTSTVQGDSPYFSPSAFAGNPWLIDLDVLVEHGLVDETGLPDRVTDARIPYDEMRERKRPVLWAAASRFLADPQHPWRADFTAYVETSDWLAPTCHFFALRDLHRGVAWWDWPDPIRRRESAAIRRSEIQLADEIAQLGGGALLLRSAVASGAVRSERTRDPDPRRSADLRRPRLGRCLAAPGSVPARR